MNSIKFLFLVTFVVLATSIKTISSSTSEESHVAKQEDELNPSPKLVTSGRFLAQKARVPRMTCDKFPRVCAAKGSHGPDCCKKQCVNVMIDRLNCGMCGKKCKYYEVCCNGMCVNPMFDRRNCGKCSNKCKRGSSCSYGMCSYA